MVRVQLTAPYPFTLQKPHFHKQLTQTAKNAYIALLSYAAYKNKLTFNITVTWVAEKLAVTRKTAGTALAQLKEFGFANDTGIVIPSTDKVAKSKATNTQPEPEQDSVNCENHEQPSIEEQVETFIKAGFSRQRRKWYYESQKQLKQAGKFYSVSE